MNETNSLNEQDMHKKMAQDTFNGVWDLLDKKDRNDYENLVMIHMAHTSVYHWSFVGQAVNMARGEWQVSRVYCAAGMAESALYHAQLSLNICQKNGIGDFDLAFGYEALARAHKVKGNFEQSQHYLELSRQAAAVIASDEDRDYVLSELATI